MTQRIRYPVKPILAFGLVAGLTACGGGGGSSGSGQGDGQMTATTVTHAQEIAITPPANGAPRTVGTIPGQALEEGGNTLNIDVAPYFRDPDDDLLMYSVSSGNPAIVTAGISGSMMTLDPVSAGAATITVTASDGYVSALQTVSATVQEREESPSTPTTVEQQVEEPSPPPSPPPPPPEPEIELTGIDIQVRRVNRRSATLAISPDPDGARLDHIILDADPYGGFNYHTRTGDTRLVGFNCSGGFKGDTRITIWIPDGTIRASATFACR